MNTYVNFQPCIATAVLCSIDRHLWYLSGELVILALCDDNIGDDIRQNMALNLLHAPYPLEFTCGKPTFPSMIGVYANPNLEEFVNSRSWLLFNFIGLGRQPLWWRERPAHEWGNHDTYLQFENFVRKMHVTNDFAKSSTNPEQREYILQMVECHRDRLSKLTKAELENL